MGVLTAIALHMLNSSRHTGCDEDGYQSGLCDSEESGLDEADGPRTRYRRRKLHRMGRGSRKRDRTAWGSYTERAPPVLPSNTSVPGFENEVLSIRRRVRRRHRALGEDDDEQHADGDEGNTGTDNSDEDVDDIYMSMEGDAPGAADQFTVDHPDASGHVTGIGFIARSALRGFHLPTSLFPFLSPSSSLFGSTTRPATRSNPSQTRSPEVSTEGSIERSTATVSDGITVLEHTETSRASSRASMAAKTHAWISLWFLITAPIIAWDVGYCFMRPRSMVGGDLHWIWQPYSIYQEVDYIYGVDAYQRGDGFTNAQSMMNVVETLLNLYYLYLQHLVGTPTAPLVGFASAVMTLSKTVLYWAQEYYCGGCAVGHNSMWNLFWYWILPNGFWLVVPTMIIYTLVNDLSHTLRFASRLAPNKKD